MFCSGGLDFCSFVPGNAQNMIFVTKKRAKQLSLYLVIHTFLVGVPSPRCLAGFILFFGLCSLGLCGCFELEHTERMSTLRSPRRTPITAVVVDVDFADPQMLRLNSPAGSLPAWAEDRCEHTMSKRVFCTCMHHGAGRTGQAAWRTME